MVDPEIVQPCLVPWSDAAGAVLEPAAGEDLESIRYEVEHGISELWRFPQDSYAVTRCEEFQPGPEKWLVIVLGAGSGLAAAMHFFVNLAEQHGLNIRVHSVRGGMGRMLRPFGFEVAETVYKLRA